MKTQSKITTLKYLKNKLVSWMITLVVMLLLPATCIWATPAENAPIWRVQMRFQTANVDDAGTDDSVRVQLNGNNSTWLDYGRDDFPRNNTFTYDLKMDGIHTISDLHYIYISKTGDDGLCLKSFALIINGREIYTQIFPGYGHWLDSDSGYTRTYLVSYSTLRQDDAWRNYTQPFPPFFISHTEMESRIEGMVGDMITGNRLQWGHLYGRGYVEITKKANAYNTLHVDLDLEADVFGPNPEVDVDFDIEVRCVNNQITLNVINPVVVVDSDWYAEILSLGLYQFFDVYVTDKLNQGLKGINLSQKIGVPTCPIIDVNSNGDITFSLPPTHLLTAQSAGQASSSQTTVASETASTQTSDKAALALNVELAKEIKADTETAFTLRAKSNRDEATNVNMQLALPSLILPVNGFIEVVEADSNRALATQMLPGENGGTVLSFNDQLAAHTENRYQLKVRFLYAPKADLQIKATLTEEGNAAAIKSTTFVQMESGEAKMQGTFQATKAVRLTAMANKEVKQ